MITIRLNRPSSAAWWSWPVAGQPAPLIPDCQTALTPAARAVYQPLVRRNPPRPLRSGERNAGAPLVMGITPPPWAQEYRSQRSTWQLRQECTARAPVDHSHQALLQAGLRPGPRAGTFEPLDAVVLPVAPVVANRHRRWWIRPAALFSPQRLQWLGPGSGRHPSNEATEAGRRVSKRNKHGRRQYAGKATQP